MRDGAEEELSPSESRDLRRIAGLMIPASEEHGVPGADDPLIFSDILKSLGRDRNEVRAALARLATLSGRAFADLDDTWAETVADTFYDEITSDFPTLGRVILQCYYRDDRVIRALGFEPRAPFPKGNILEQGDWSLLDLVRTRAKLWRDAP